MYVMNVEIQPPPPPPPPHIYIYIFTNLSKNFVAFYKICLKVARMKKCSFHIVSQELLKVGTFILAISALC